MEFDFKRVMFAARYSFFEVLVVLFTYYVTDYTFDDTYDMYFMVAAAMVLLWSAFKKLEY